MPTLPEVLNEIQDFIVSQVSPDTISPASLGAVMGDLAVMASQAPLSALTAAEIPTVAISMAAFRTAGYAAKGDGGDAFYVPGAAGGPMALQDASGAWWQLAPTAQVNAKACGAKGDGATDDTAALNLAASIAWTWGVPVYLPKGVFVTQQWSTVSPIVGAGQYETTIKAAPTLGTGAVVSVYGTSDSPVKNWFMTGVTVDGASLEGGAQNLKFMYATKVTVSDCSFINSSQSGIYAGNCIALVIRDCYVYNCGMTTNATTNKQGIGINVYDTSGFIFNNRIIQTGGAGIGATSYLSGAELGDIEIASNRIYNSGVTIAEDNITAYAYQNQHIKVHHNFCNTSQNANMHIGSAYVQVTNNECLNGVVSGISVATRFGNYDLLPVPSIIVSENIVTTPSGDGIHIDVPAQSIVANNVVNWPARDGINITGRGAQLSIAGNIVRYPGSDGVTVAGVIDATVTGNVLMLLSTGSINTLGALTPGSGYTPPWAPFAATTAASGTGSVATLTFAGGTQPHVGYTIVVAGVTPAGYNGTYTVTAEAAGSISYACTATGAQTVAGYITIKASSATPYPNVQLAGGSGTGASADLLVNTDGTIASVTLRDLGKGYLGSSSTTGASGTGTVATVTFAGSTVVPVGSTVLIAGVTPSGYNGSYVVTASSAGSVSFASSATGAQTVAGAISDALTVDPASVGDAGSGFKIAVASVYGAPAGYCLNNTGPAPGSPSTKNLLVVGNSFIGGANAINQADSAASLVIGTNAVRYGGTNPYLLQGLDIVIGQTGFGGVNTGLATGASVLATGAYSEAWGDGASSKARTGFRATACGHFSVQGDAQSGALVLRGATGGGTTCTLTADQNALNPHNAANCNVASTLMGVSGRVIVSDSTGANTARFQIEGMYGANAAGTAVAIMGSMTASLMTSSGTGSGWTIAVTADTTSMGFKIVVTAATNCFAVARLATEEMIW